MDSEELDVIEGSEGSPGNAGLMRGESSSIMQEEEGCSDDDYEAVSETQEHVIERVDSAEEITGMQGESDALDAFDRGEEIEDMDEDEQEERQNAFLNAGQSFGPPNLA